MRDKRQPTALGRPQLRQRRRDEFRRRLERRHALHVVANIGQRVAYCLKIKQRRASFWVKTPGTCLFWAERELREASIARVSTAA